MNLWCSHECYCDFYLGRYSQIAETSCNSPCIGDATAICGGFWAISVYQIIIPQTTASTSTVVSDTSTEITTMTSTEWTTITTTYSTSTIVQGVQTIPSLKTSIYIPTSTTTTGATAANVVTPLTTSLSCSSKSANCVTTTTTSKKFPLKSSFFVISNGVARSGDKMIQSVL